LITASVSLVKIEKTIFSSLKPEIISVAIRIISGVFAPPPISVFGGKISAKKGKTKGRVVVDPALVDA
jgi:hypothetical protein